VPGTDECQFCANSSTGRRRRLSAYDLGVAKVEAIEYGDRKVFSVAAFNRGLADWLGRLPTVWVEGEVTELRRQERWQTVFFTLKDKDGSACVEAGPA